jgi:hypothetical protein
MNDYAEFAPLSGNKVKKGGMNDYAEFVVPTSSKFQMKRGGMNDYGEFVTPDNYVQKQGGLDDYYI